MQIIREEGIRIKSKRYIYYGPFKEGMAVVKNRKGEYGYIDNTGKEVIKCQYIDADDFKNGEAKVKVKRNYSVYITLPGKEGMNDNERIIWDEYKTNCYDRSTISTITYVNLYYKNSKNNRCLPEFKYNTYTRIQDFSEGLAEVRRNYKTGFIDKTGKEVIECKYSSAHDFHEGLAAVELNGKWGFIDKTGKVVIDFKYDSAYIFSEGLAAVELNGKYGFIDKTGKVVIECKYDSVSSFHEGMARVEINGKYGFIDKTGKEMAIKYDEVRDFHEGLAAVSVLASRNVNGIWVSFYKTGFIDKTGKEVIECKYECYCPYFNSGLVQVELEGKKYYINHEGKIVPELYDIEKISNAEIYSSDSKELKEIADKIREAKHVELYYDLIIDGNVVSFITLEEREQFEKELFIEEEDFEKQYVLSKK